MPLFQIFRGDCAAPIVIAESRKPEESDGDEIGC